MILVSLSAHRILCVRWSVENKARRSGRFQSSDTAAINDGNRLKKKEGLPAASVTAVRAALHFSLFSFVMRKQVGA